MKIINNPPDNINDCELYLKFVERCKSSSLREKVDKVIEEVTPLLSIVNSGPFNRYTLHNPNHAKKIVHLAGNIIHKDSLEKISPLDMALIIISAFMHDVGMVITNHERNEIINDDIYLDFLQDNPEIHNEIKLIREKHSEAIDNEKTKFELKLHQIQEYIISDILRKRHGERERYEDIISTIKTTTGRKDLFEFNGATFEDILIDICESHNLESTILGELKSPYEAKYPRDIAIGGEYINVQFCAAVLRICDILDFDRERTPNILFESLGINSNELPGTEISLSEWEKHMAVHSIEINNGELIISGDCKHPSIEASVIEFSNIIQREIHDTAAILKINSQEISEKYMLTLPNNVRTRLKSIGYVFKDLRLHLNPDSVMTLLMGEQLYSTPYVAIRELIQNSIDACRVLNKVTLASYTPEINISKTIDKNNKHWLEIADNGIGMDYFVISEYLFRVGSSYYNSSDFKRFIKTEYNSISRFGIGLISVFMITDILKVTTCNKHSTRGDIKERTLFINNKKSLAYITERNTGRQGTIISLLLKDEYASNYFYSQLEHFINTVVIRPDVQINVDLLEKWTVKKRYIELNPVAIEKAKKENIEYVVLELKRFSKYVEGYVIFPFVNSNGKLSINHNGSKLSFDEQNSINPHHVFINYPGNRLTVNGFRMGLKRAHRLFGKNLRFVYDINIIGDNDVKFDVARDRIIGRGTTIVKTRIKNAIVDGLHGSGIYDKLSADTVRYIISSEVFYESDLKLPSENKIEEIKALIPDGQWPIGLHHEIAQKINLPSSLTYNAMSYLLDNKLIPDGRRNN